MKLPLAPRPSLLALAATLLAGCGGGGSHGGSNDGSSGAPTITTQPASFTAAVGATVSFTVVTSSAGATYQWSKGAVAIAGATSATYTLAAVAATDAGVYSCRVTVGTKSTTSASATLTVGATGAPAITTPPQSLTVAPGGEAVFHVVASGTAPLVYQWYKGEFAIDGATGSNYAISPVTADAVGSYHVRVTNSAGSVDSSAVTLTLGSASAPIITTQPRSATIVSGGTATFTVAASNAGGYQWTKNGVAIAGATASTYSIAQAGTAAAGDYAVVVTNAQGSATSAIATLTVVTKPVITAQPTSVTVDPGVAVAFAVGATGINLTYQWYHNAIPISGATSPTYAISTVTATDGGAYYVVVTNLAGTAKSATAVLTVVPAPTIITQPGSTTVGVGSVAKFTVVGSSSETIAYQWYKNGTAISGATSASYTTPATASTDNGATFTVTLINGGGTTTSATATLTVDSAPTITTQPASISVKQPTTAVFSVVATASGALSYQWYRIAPGTTTGTALSGATGASYTTAATSVSADNGAKFYVVVSNDGLIGTTSSTATLTVTSS